MDPEITKQQILLREKALTVIKAVANDPAARLTLRENFYLHYKDIHPYHPAQYGFGQSEIAFMQWELNRGVLNPIDDTIKKGSRWWRSMNLDLCYYAELASLYFDGGISSEGEKNGVLKWIDYLKDPSPKTWYRAHNASIATGYLQFIHLANEEEKSEQIFVNEVLIRLLFAQSMVEGEDFAFGKFGELFADPDGNSVHDIIALPEFYPDTYPLSETDTDYVEYKSKGFLDRAAAFFDQVIIGWHLKKLYSLSEEWLGVETLSEFIKDGKPDYPNIDPSVLKIQTQVMAETLPTGNFPKKKIVILGGGMGALTTAYELTNYEGWQDHFEITLYQMGWRLGGKTATGRGVDNRIQERGIHIFQGWYDNAWRLVKDAYGLQETLHLNPDSPFKTWKDAFRPHNTTLLTEFSFTEGKWINWPIIFPPNNLEPGSDVPQTTWQILHKIIGLALELVLGSPYQKGNDLSKWIFGDFLNAKGETQQKAQKKTGIAKLLSWLMEALRGVKKNIEKAVLHEIYSTADRLLTAPDHEKHQHFSAIINLFEKLFHQLGKVIDDIVVVDNRLRRIVTLIEWILINLKGIFADVYVKESYTFNFALVNDWNYRDWLKKHGASELVLNSAAVRFIYTGSFANLIGENPGQIATDIALRMCLLSVSYKGSFIYMLNAGTGDTLITPVYQVLKERGVKFKFFNRVDQVHYSANGEIEEISVAQQVTLKDKDGNYDPVTKVNGINSWPSAPKYEQIVDTQAQQLQAENIDLESSWSSWKDVSGFKLKKGVDFDQVVLGIPAAALKSICSEIIGRNERWKNMVEKVVMVPTFGVQIWARPNLVELGYDHSAWGLPADTEPDSVTYSNPHYSWTDMTPILKQENWNVNNMPGHVSYFCGTITMPAPLPPYSDISFPHDQKIRIMALTEQWLHDYLGWFFPKATNVEYPNGFNLDLLIDPDNSVPPLQGLDKLTKQFFSVNIDPTNHYTLALPGANKYRFRADETDFKNLFVCGDWTNFGLNVGHIEGTVVSGLRCAHAILKIYGITNVNPILGGAENIDN
ncbi:MAG: FAD-dependent oxidoreductase [Ferruginibacter sp.]